MKDEQYFKIMKRLVSYMKDNFLDKHWTELPTVSILARRYRCRRQDILDMIEDVKAVRPVPGYSLDLVVGCRNSVGHACFSESEYAVEVYQDSDEL